MTWAPGGRGGTAAIGLAVGPAGRMVVAFFRQGASRRVIREVVAAVAPPRHRLGPFDVIGQHGGIGTFSAAVTARGRVAVAWGTQDGGEEANQPYRTYAALARPDGRFAAPRRLDPGATHERAPSSPVIAAAPDGTVTFAWSNVVGGHGLPLTYPVRVATAPPSSRFGRATQLAPDGAVGDVAVARDGTTLITWMTASPGAEHVEAALRPSCPTDVRSSSGGTIRSPRSSSARPTTWCASQPAAEPRRARTRPAVRQPDAPS